MVENRTVMTFARMTPSEAAIVDKAAERLQLTRSALLRGVVLERSRQILATEPRQAEAVRDG